jgi:formamidopyrimidine-DNA glycosylase
MPELPEVETIARRLQGALPGRTIAHARLGAADLYRRGSRRLPSLDGGRIRAVERLGKAILFRIDAPAAPTERALVVHLGMTGRFDFLDGTPGESARRAVKHRHGRVVFEDGSELHYIDPRRFGYLFVGGTEGLPEALNIGPDPFQTRPRALSRILEGRSASIKALLLDQRLISGLGNIYVDELLFLSRVHPATPGAAVAADAGLILNASRRVLRRALRWGGTTLRDYRRPDGSSGRFQLRLRVYGREGEPCPRCRGRIEKMVVAGRGTHVCPSCQRRRA